jgi:tetratricopeptide (TPR) repeat protein
VQMSFDISKDIYQKYGSIARSNILYLKSLTKMLERNRLFEVIRVRNHNFKITDDDLNIMSLILGQVGNKLDESGEWKIMAEMLSNPHELNYKSISKLEPTNENIHAKIIALGELDRMNDVENLLEIFSNNEKGLFTYAIINLNKNPEITQSIVHKILENDKPDPLHLAVLAFAYEKLGNFADSYSSICLALNIWPNEYEWEILAGKLSKQLGNNLASFSHFKNAENYNKNNRDTLEPNDISNEQIGIIEKSVLGSEFTNSAKDIPQLFKIIDFLIKEKRFEKIEFYLNKLKKFGIPFKEIPLIEAKIELNDNRFSESLKLVETVLQDDRWNSDAIIIKSEIISKIENAKSALEYLDQIDFEKLDNTSALIIQRTNLLEQSFGVDSAIEYLIKEKEINKGNLEIAVCLANLYLKEGKPLIAQDIAIEALNFNADNSGLLHLLGNISKDLGDLDKAIDYMMRSITIAPFFTENYIQLSKMFESRRDYKDSIEILKKGLEILPNDFSLLRYTGLLFYKQGKYTEAQVKLKKALNMYPKDSDLVKIIRILENSLQIKNQKMKNR